MNENEILSQAEIDNLLSAVEVGDFGGDYDDDDDEYDFGQIGCGPSIDNCGDASDMSRSNTVKMYDFKRPDKFSRDNIRTIQMMFETYARLNTTYLSAKLNSFVNVHVASVDQLTYEEFSRSIPNPTTLAEIYLEPLQGLSIMEIDPTVSFAMIDRLMGGEGESLKDNRELTEIETNVIKNVVNSMIQNLIPAFSKVIGLKPKLAKIESNIQFSQIVPPNEMVVLVTLETRIGEVEGMTNFCIPYSIIESIIPKINATNWYSWKKDTITNVNNIENVANVPMEISAKLPSFKVPLSTLINLKKKSIIGKFNKFGITTDVELYVNGNHKMNAEISMDEITPLNFFHNKNQKNRNIGKIKHKTKKKEPVDIKVSTIDNSSQLIKANKEIEKLKNEITGLRNNISPKPVKNITIPFAWLDNVDEEILSRLLALEHTQTMTLVISHIKNADSASKVISLLPIELRADIIKRLSKMDLVSSETKQAVGTIMENKYSMFEITIAEKTGGMNSTCDVVKKMDSDTKDSIMETLEEEDPELAEEIHNRNGNKNNQK